MARYRLTVEFDATINSEDSEALREQIKAALPAPCIRYCLDMRDKDGSPVYVHEHDELCMDQDEE